MVPWIALIVFMIAAAAPWFIVILIAVGGHEPEPGPALAAFTVPGIAFAILFLTAWVNKRVVLDVRARMVRESGVPSAAQSSVALTAHAALDEAERAEARLRDALSAIAAGSQSRWTTDQFIKVSEAAINKLAETRRDLKMAERPMTPAYGGELFIPYG